jgi:hypothetical protein
MDEMHLGSSFDNQNLATDFKLNKSSEHLERDFVKTNVYYIEEKSSSLTIFVVG